LCRFYQSSLGGKESPHCCLCLYREQIIQIAFFTQPGVKPVWVKVDKLSVNPAFPTVFGFNFIPRENGLPQDGGMYLGTFSRKTNIA